MSRFATLLVVLTAVVGAFVGTASDAAPRGGLVLPLDIEARGPYLYIADAERHQVLRYDLRRKRLSVFAGTGTRGTSGDGGPAVKARLGEPTEIVFDTSGNLYFADVNQGRIRRVDRRGTISTVARVPEVAGLAVHPDGRSLAVAAIDGWVYRVELPTGTPERLAGDGTQATSGDGGPATEARLNGPHDVTYDAAGNLLIGVYDGVRRIDAGTGRIETAFAREATKVVLGARGSAYLLAGSPSGGTVTQVDAGGAVLRVIGTGKLNRHTDRAAIGRVGFLPSDVEPLGETLLIAQTQPIAAIRRLGPGSRSLTTLVR